MSFPPIQTTLYANTAFSTFCGLLILADPSWWTVQVLAVPTLVFQVLGLGLLGFALEVFLQARSPRPSPFRLKLVLIADLAWVLATPVVVFLQAGRFTTLGLWLMVDIAIIVAVFAALEWQGLRQLSAVPQR